MRVLLDTNVLLRYRQQSSPSHSLCSGAIEQLESKGCEVCLCAQNLIEYWAVASRSSAQNGLGLSLDEIDRDLTAFEQGFTILDEPTDIRNWWRGLVSRHAVSGKQVHDARIVALMQALGVTHLLTLNPTDFGRYSEITIIEPQDILS